MADPLLALKACDDATDCAVVTVLLHDPFDVATRSDSGREWCQSVLPYHPEIPDSNAITTLPVPAQLAISAAPDELELG